MWLKLKEKDCGVHIGVSAVLSYTFFILKVLFSLYTQLWHTRESCKIWFWKLT